MGEPLRKTPPCNRTRDRRTDGSTITKPKQVCVFKGTVPAEFRQTLEPYSDDAAISIRFFIPREILSDSTTHTILRIIRELVVNAIRHGHADKVKVAGTLENGKLLFSVSDNGCGFDTESVPGLTEGHFGLQGIRERVDGLDGNFEIESKAGQGSKATVSIVLPSPLNEEKT